MAQRQSNCLLNNRFESHPSLKILPIWFSGRQRLSCKQEDNIPRRFESCYRLNSILSTIYNKITTLTLTTWKAMKVLNREKTATLFLFLGTFFNPLGYDALLKWLMDTTGSYWFSISIFYLLSLSCFILYFIFAKINPLKLFKIKRNI